ncbi:MAG: HAD family phosphatase [Erysipelotrichaceae bacterium]|nr:HAD family phosphatase [Erysipelotrichaceae bacterium]
MNYREQIKAVAFDFDGTLIDFNYNATEYTRKALIRLNEVGYKVCLSSGRPCFMALRAFKEKFPDAKLDYIFGCNGSEFMDVAKNETTILYPLHADEIRYIGKVLHNDFLTVGIYEGEKFLVNQLRDSRQLDDWMKARHLTAILYDFQSNDTDRSKVIVFNDREDREREDEFLKNVDLTAFSSFYSSPYCFEVAPKGVSKARSCEELARILGCEMHQILSFGDMENDMPMLRVTTGVIMDNASEELKAQIPLHTSRVDELGVYDFLSRNSLI